MSWWDKCFLGIWFVIILSFCGCQDPNQIGLPLQPDTSKVQVYYREINLHTSVIQNDSVLTRFSQGLLTGISHDGNFGGLDIKSFTQVILGSTKLNIPDAATFDSLVLTLNVKYSYGQEAPSEQSYEVHQLAEQLYDSVPYFTFSSAQYNPEIIGSIHFSMRESTDTVMTIKINQDFGQNFFNDILDSTKVDQDSGKSFINYFKGLAIIADQANNSVIGYDTRSKTTALTLYYKIDTTHYKYAFSLAFGVNFHQILADRSGTVLQGIENQKYQDFYPSDNRSYLQSGAATVIKIDLKPLLDFMDSIPTVVINKANIDIYGEVPEPHFPPPTSIYLYYADTASNNQNKRVRINGVYQGVLGEGTSNLANPLYTEATHGYSLAATVFSEALIKGKIPYTQLLIFPPENSYSQSVNQFIVKTQNVKCRIYFTTVAR
jgi:hypothetical protein